MKGSERERLEGIWLGAVASSPIDFNLDSTFVS